MACTRGSFGIEYNNRCKEKQRARWLAKRIQHDPDFKVIEDHNFIWTSLNRQIGCKKFHNILMEIESRDLSIVHTRPDAQARRLSQTKIFQSITIAGEC
jgi:hypothetical protein